MKRPGRRTPRERMMMEGRKAGDKGVYIVRFEGCESRVEAEKVRIGNPSARRRSMTLHKHLLPL